MRVQLASLSCVFLAATACAPLQETVVHVQDPTALAVEVSSSDGKKTVLPGTPDPATARVPTTFGTGEVDAIRRGAGGIALRCSTCVGVSPMTILTDGGALITFGDPKTTVVRDGDLLRIKIAYLYDDLAVGHLRAVEEPGSVVSTDGNGRRARSPSTSRLNVLELVTPASNVLDVHTKKSSTTGPGIALLVAGVAVGALGAFALASRSSADTTERNMLLAGGITGLAIGGGMAAGGTVLLVTSPSSEGSSTAP